MSSAIPISRFPHPPSNPPTHRNARALLQLSPQYVMLSALRNVSSLTFQYPISVRLLHATAKNKAATAHDQHSPQGRQYPGSRPPRSVTSTAADSQISKNNYRNGLHPSLVARIAQLSNTMVQHSDHRLQGPHPASCLPLGSPARIQQCAHQNSHPRTVVEHMLSGAPDPSTPSDQQCVSTPPAAATLTNG